MTAARLLERLVETDLVGRTGQVTRILPTFIEADGPSSPVGTLCTVETLGSRTGARGQALAQVIGVNPRSVTLALFDSGEPTFSGARVSACLEADSAPVGDSFRGRAVDAFGRPIDGGPAIRATTRAPLGGTVTSPLERVTSRRVLDTGVRAIDVLLTLGQGQRVGVFAASGVGKTSLMAQLVRQVEADRCIVCLVGERGREVEALWSGDLDADRRARTTLVAATADQSATTRVRAAQYALALAEHWRGQGLHVLLLLDSVTRLAMALREIGLAAGEPPTVRAYTPGVFAAIPRLVERCGALKSGGAITAVLTVLTETDDADDPISELMKSLLDGHIVLSRGLAEQGHFPAIDAPRSISRLAQDLAEPERRAQADKAIELLSVYDGSKTMIEAGLYAKGADARIDEALARRPVLLKFLRQDRGERTPMAEAWKTLADTVGRS